MYGFDFNSFFLVFGIIIAIVVIISIVIICVLAKAIQNNMREMKSKPSEPYAFNQQRLPQARNPYQMQEVEKEQEKIQEQTNEEPSRPKFCGYCGEKVPVNAKFCPSCGAKT